MSKRMTIMSIALLVIFGGLIGFNLVKQMMIKRFFAHFQLPAVTVSSVVAKKLNWKPYFSSVGNFVAVNGVDVNAQSGGKVVAIHFDSGESVEKGSPLIDIDDSVDQATLKFNQADLALQRTNYQRQVDLLKRNATAVSSVDEAKARLLQAEASVESTQASIQFKHIKAPFDGVLGIRQINLGQFIQPSQTSIVSLQSMDPIYLDFYLPEQYLDQINLQQNLEFTLEQNPDIIFNGKITAINSKVDANTHNVQIQASIANCPTINSDRFSQAMFKKSRKLASGKFSVTCDTELNHSNHIKQFNFIPGMFASLNIEQPALHDVIVLPTTAISYTMYGDSVFIIEKNPKDNAKLTVKRVFVTTGETHGNYTVIKKGIEENQLVVATGELKLQDGTQVNIDNTYKLADHDNIDLLGE